MPSQGVMKTEATKLDLLILENVIQLQKSFTSFTHLVVEEFMISGQKWDVGSLESEDRRRKKEVGSRK